VGIFSSKKKTTVGTTVERVIKDNLLPDSAKTGIMSAILGDGDVADNVMEELIGGIGMRAERMYEYGRTKYTHGLPSGQVKSATQGRQEADAILTTIEGAPVEIDYCHFGPPNNLHIGWTKLLSEHGYSFSTNTLYDLSVLKGVPVYLKDMVVVVPEAQKALMSPGALAQWGPPATAGKTPERKFQTDAVGAMRAPSPVESSTSASTDFVRVDYIWEVITSVPGSSPVVKAIHEASMTINVNVFDELADWFQVRYSVGTAIKYAMYKVGSGTYPTLDAVFLTPPQVNGTYFPFAYFRYAKVSEIADKTKESYKTAKKLVKFMGIDYDAVATAINSNPGIADVEQAMLIMAVPAITTNPLERRYLYEYFDNQYANQLVKFETRVEGNTAAFFAKIAELTVNATIIQDKRFSMSLSNNGVFKIRKGGSIGAVGFYDSGFTTHNTAQNYTDENTGIVSTAVTAVKYHYYRKQIAHALYDEIQVIDLKMQYRVFEGHSTIGDEADTILLIPIDRSISEDYSIPEREVLYARSMHYVFNSRQVTVIKWYQTGVFKALITLIAIVITVWSMGADGGALLAAIASGSSAAITAALIPVLINLVIGAAIGAALKIFVKMVGAEFAFLVAIFAAAYGSFQAFKFGSITGAPWAKDLLQLATGLSKAINAGLQDLMQGLSKEYGELSLLMTEADKKLKEADKLLENNNFLSPFVIFGESPKDFYNRTVHSGNIGMQSISAISSYVDIALTLPKLDETIGGNTYVS